MSGFDLEYLGSLIQHHCSELLLPITLERIPTGLFNTSFFVHTPERELVLRIAPPNDAVFVFYERDMMRQEPAIHQRLLQETTVPVASILAYDDSHAQINHDFLIMERLPGRPLNEMQHVDFDEVLRQVGDSLAQTHRLTAQTYGYLGEHRPMEPQRTWVDAFAIMWHKLIDDIMGVGHYSTEEGHWFRQLLDKHIRLFERTVPSSLLHMDIWHQNILVDTSGKVTGLVDWDRALWGDPEIEFAVLDYCGISEPAFWEGYGQSRDLSAEARIRQVFYLLYELQKYIVIREGRHRDSHRARQYKAQVMGIAQTIG